MNVVVRADASFDIGSGHIMRCLTIAKALQTHGAEVVFFCEKLEGNLIDFVKESGFHVQELKENNNDFREIKNYFLSSEVDLLIIDHYLIGEEWEKELANDVKKIFVVDDLANRRHYCHFLLDQTYMRSPADYESLVPKDVKYLLGSQYAILRPEFQNLREKSLLHRKSNELKHLIISMGGADSDNYTLNILKSLEKSNLDKSIKLSIVLGKQYKHLSGLKEKLKSTPFEDIEIHQAIDNMAELMSQSDLAIGAAGTTSWERCCLGLPCLTFELAENQKTILSNLEKQGAILRIKKVDDLQSIDFKSLDLTKMSKISSQLVDGSGLERVMKEILR